MGSLFSSPKAYEPPSRTDAEVQAAAEQERKRKQLMVGRSSTIATSATGLSSEGNIAKKTLGG